MIIPLGCHEIGICRLKILRLVASNLSVTSCGLRVNGLPNHRNHDVSYRQEHHCKPCVLGQGWFFVEAVGQEQNGGDDQGLGGDFGVIDGFPVRGIGIDQGVADADEAEAGYEGQEGGMCDSG